MEYISKNPEDTAKIADELADKFLNKPHQKAIVLGLVGDLGAGKTTFVQKLARKLGITENINSPTFLYLKQYGKLIHIDAYRLEKSQDILSFDFKKLLTDPENIIVIEWANKISDILPDDAIIINFEHVDQNTRKISLN